MDWVRPYVRFHRMQSREDLWGGEPKIGDGPSGSDFRIPGLTEAMVQPAVAMPFLRFPMIL